MTQMFFNRSLSHERGPNCAHYVTFKTEQFCENNVKRNSRK